MFDTLRPSSLLVQEIRERLKEPPLNRSYNF
jgi:hypothetical protein